MFDERLTCCAAVVPPQDFSVRAGRVPMAAAAAGVTSSWTPLSSIRSYPPRSFDQAFRLVSLHNWRSGAGNGEGPQDVTVKAGASSRSAVVAAANAELDASRSQRAAEPVVAAQAPAPMRSNTFDRLVAGPSGAPRRFAALQSALL